MPGKIYFVLLSLIIFLTIVVRRYIPTLFVAPVSGGLFIVCYLLAVRKFSVLSKPFEFFGSHSMNMWLTHMFFYMPMYGGLAYYAKYPLLIFISLVLMSLAASFIINCIANILTVKRGIKNA